MKKIVSLNDIEQAIEIANIIANYVNQCPTALLCLAAGDSTSKTYAQMLHLQSTGKADFTKCRIIGLDEWVGLDETVAGGCKHYIYSNVITPLGIPADNIVFFDACSTDLAAECRLIDNYLINNGPIDISLMGVGMNGHIALNEPNCSFNSASMVVPLDTITMEVSKKYFNTPTTVTHGITLGLSQIMASKLLIVLANGERKQRIMKLALEGPVTNKVPVSIAQTHHNCVISLDEAANL